MKKTAPERAWVRLPSGRRLDLLLPSPLDWDDEDLAIGLSRTFRWGGHSTWPVPLSVAQHSLTVLWLRRQGAPMDSVTELRELLHDAEEGLIGYDPISPLKPFLGPNFQVLMERLQQMVFIRYGLPSWTPASKKRHKKADILAAASEAVHVAGWTRQEVAKVLKIKLAPLDEDPLVEVYGGKPWQPWTAEVAAERFLAELRSCLDEKRS
ncbi:MAG: phosphohydrolase [Sulfuricellaceae bacterium]|nr:phosphohydrolase [Sulfuricellaceae bacterium]